MSGSKPDFTNLKVHYLVEGRIGDFIVKQPMVYYV
jgi:hypothetical protein